MLFDRDRYRLLRVLGRGGFSEVWLAEDTRTGIHVALKVYAPGHGLDDDGVKLFSQEFSLVFDLNHGNLLRPSHFDVCERMPYLVMPFYPRGSAAKLAGNISETEAWQFLHDVASGLAYLHKLEPPVIHQDIKPDNVMMSNHGGFLITDFGISVKVRSTLRKSMPQQHTSGGTVSHMSPERFSKDNMPIKASDVWALGATLYELLTGNPPFGEHGGLVQKSGAEIPDIDGYFTDELKQTVEHCLALQPWNRPSAEQLVKISRQHLPQGHEDSAETGQDSADDIPDTPAKKSSSKKKTKAGILVAAVLTALIAGALFYMRYSNNQKQYADNVAKAGNFHAVARYDSALIYFDKALEYVDADSIRHKREMLRHFIPALQDFYNARYRQAYEGFQKAADMGSGDACYYLGEMVYNGLATAKDYNRGWEYTLAAYQRGFKMACWRIANAYETGRGVPQNKDTADFYYFEAIESIKKLSENGDPEALGNLGGMYSGGKGVAQNDKRAFECHYQAAQAGYAFEMSNLALYYQYGYGTEKDEEEAMKWYIRSAGMGNPGSQLTLGKIYLYGYCGQKENSEKGIELITKAAEQNYSPALTSLGYLYWEGKHVKEDLSKSFVYSLRAIEYDNDNTTAMINVAHDYKGGRGTDKDYLKSMEYYLKAQKSDPSQADINLYIGRLYRDGGPNLAKNESEYIRYCELAIEQGSTNAKDELGTYFNSAGYDAFEKKNYKQARTYFSKAVKYGNQTAKKNLDTMNEFGI